MCILTELFKIYFQAVQLESLAMDLRGGRDRGHDEGRDEGEKYKYRKKLEKILTAARSRSPGGKVKKKLDKEHQQDENDMVSKLLMSIKIEGNLKVFNIEC